MQKINNIVNPLTWILPLIMTTTLVLSMTLATTNSRINSNSKTPLATDCRGNPSLQMFSHAITFYASFDQHAKADISIGKAMPQDKGHGLHWAKGIYGAALRGRKKAAIYPMKKNIDLSRTGALMFWVCPLHWAGGRNPHPRQIPFLTIHNHGLTLYLARQGAKANHESIEAVFGPHVNQAHTRAYIRSGSSKNWTKSRWHLLALNWGHRYLALSIDGGKFKKDIQPKMTPAHYRHAANIMRIATVRKHTPYLVDELLILNRPISNKEIKTVYESG